MSEHAHRSQSYGATIGLTAVRPCPARPYLAAPTLNTSGTSLTPADSGPRGSWDGRSRFRLERGHDARDLAIARRARQHNHRLAAFRQPGAAHEIHLPAHAAILHRPQPVS